MSLALPELGFGLGLRPEHYEAIITSPPANVDWFEIVSENYCEPGGRPLYYLDKIRENYPMVMHGVSLSIGGTDPLNLEYLGKIKALAKRIEPAWISDHLCFSNVNGVHFHDLLPLPYTEEALNHIASRVRQVQDILGCRILLENVSSYITYEASQMPEWEFLMGVAERADCYILLDVNNIYVSAFNHHFSPETYLNAIDPQRVPQFHVAGHTRKKDHIIDTHDAGIIEEVWSLYAKAVERMPHAATLIERDDNIPPLEELMQELDRARAISESVLMVEEIA